LLLAQLQMFNYVYPGYRSNVPAWVLEQLIERTRADVGRDEQDGDLTRGTLISRFSFAIDVREWGFSDPRGEMVRSARNHPIVRQIGESDVWDERSDEAS
jgi:hypothetical protein